MIPFLHIGPLTIPTFGLMVATGLLAAAYLLQADFDRRREQFQKGGYLKSGGKPSHHDEGFLIIGVAGLAGLVGARLYHVLESPRELLADPSVLISRFGFAWVGGFLGVLSNAQAASLVSVVVGTILVWGIRSGWPAGKEENRITERAG